MNDTPESPTGSQSAGLTCYIADSQKLVTLADSCSDVLYGGESGWERVDFKQFVADCRKAIAFGVRCKVAGLMPPTEHTTINTNSCKEERAI